MVDDYDLMSESELCEALEEIDTDISKKERELANLKYTKDKVLRLIRLQR